MISSLAAEGLRLERGDRRLIHDLSFELRAGQALAVTGPNGAGKTSLLRAVAGLLRPAAGRVRFFAGETEREAALACSQDLHWLGAQDGLKGGRTAWQELRFWTRWTGGDLVAAEAALEALGLADRADLQTRQLSSGQRRRLALARLIAAPRSLWLLDEPLAPLDAHWRGRLGLLMAGHLAAGGLILAAVHDPLPVPALTLALGDGA